MLQDASAAFTENIKDDTASFAEEMEIDGFDEKLETFVTCMMQYMLEKIRKARLLLDCEDQAAGISCNSPSENTLKAPSGFSSMEGERPYSEKEVIKRFGD
ncbi:MAG: hypothetical protein HGB36_09055 [Chlorobiaceae bacterium]|jgi:hypothetical protein|nr:hypothetical protein [Chlorobiaceae bacterium]